MKKIAFSLVRDGVALLLLSGCSNGLLLGEQRCYGEGVDCDSDAPTLTVDAPLPVSVFDVVASRNVTAAWTYDLPVESPFYADTRLAAAPGGGVWTLYDLKALKLERVNSAGEPVESHSLSQAAYLWADEELNPVVVSWLYGQVKQWSLNPIGELVEWTTADLPQDAARRLLVSGPERSIRVAEFQQQGSYLAAYSSQGELRWRQSDLRDARDFPFEEVTPAPVAAYHMVALSDGSIAVGVPKTSPEARRAALQGLSGVRTQAQGITLVEPDGNVRWDIVLGEPTASIGLAAGIDGSVVYATHDTNDLHVSLIDREGAIVGNWIGRRHDFHDVASGAICSDTAGDVYVGLFTGDRSTPVPTVCRMSANDPSAEVVCLGVEDVVLPTGGGVQPAAIDAITAPEPGAVVLAIEQLDSDSESAITRLVRVEFEP